MALDSAYCCHAYREEFLDLFQSDEYFVKEQVVFSQNRAVLSLLKRFNEKIRSVKFEDSITPAQEELVKKHCHNLTHVEFRNEEYRPPTLWTILKTNPHIERLNLLHYHNFNKCRPFCRSFEGIVLPKLSSLTLQDYQISNGMVLDVIKRKGIVQLDLSYCHILSSIFLQIARLCPQLKIVKLASVIGLTNACLNEATAACRMSTH